MVRRSFVLWLGLGLIVLSAALPGGGAGPSGGPAGRQQLAPSISTATLDLKSLLPRAGEVPGFAPKGEPLVYRGDDLFTYIDGGADIYNEFGFRQVLVQDYEAAPQKTVTLELFEMADAAAAFGMFSFKTSARGSAVKLGQGGRLEDYYLNFWKGPLVVTVTGFDDSPESVGGVRAIAQAVDGKVQIRGEKPALAAAFPPEWAERGGLKYLRGPLGLRNLHPVFSRLAIRFGEGAAGWPADGVLAVILKGQTASETTTALADAEKAFSSSPPFSGYQSRDGGFEARDAKGNFIGGRLLDRHLALLVAKDRPADEQKLWERLRAAIAGQRR